MTAPLALFRCDASPAIGAGHVTRCLALAEELNDGAGACLPLGPTIPTLRAGEGVEVRVLGGAVTDQRRCARRC